VHGFQLLWLWLSYDRMDGSVSKFFTIFGKPARSVFEFDGRDLSDQWVEVNTGDGSDIALSKSMKFLMADDMIEQNIHPDLKQDGAPGACRGRRRFLGAGAAATPFVLTLVSQPALGATCFTPSRSLSRNTSVSQQGQYGECFNAESPGNYKAQQEPGKGAYHWPAAVPPNTPMHPLFYQGGEYLKTQFIKQVNGRWESMTLGEALQVNAAGQVHFHVIGAYLNKMGGNGAEIPDSVLTAQDILRIWQEYATKGYYEPMAGIQWYAENIVDYLKTNGIVG